MTIKIGPASINTKTLEFKYDRRSLKGKSAVKHAAAILGAAAVTAALAAVVKK